METARVSPGLIIRVCALGRNVCTFVSCGLGGAAGTPLVCRNAKLTGSMQSLLQVAKPNVHSRLSMLSAAHHFVALQLSESTNGV